MAAKKSAKKETKSVPAAKTYEAFYKSFYSKQFYHDVARKWEGCGFKVLAVLTLVFTLVASVVIMGGGYIGLKSDEFKAFVNDLPTINIKNGEISMDKPSPYIIHPEGEDRILIIDTSEKMAAKSEGELIDWMKQNKYKMVVTKHRFLMEDEKKNEIKSIDLRESKELEANITHENIHKWATIGLFVLVPLFALLMYGFVLVYFIIVALIYAVIGILIAKLLKTEIEFSGLQRLAACAILPMVIVSAFSSHILGLSIPFLVLVIGDIAFLTFGLKSAQNSQK